MTVSWSNLLKTDKINLAQVLVRRHVLEGRGDRAAIHHPAGTCTYGELWQRVASAAQGLRELGVKRGDRVLISAPDGLALPVAFYSVMALGAVAVLANPLLNANDLEYMATHVGARFAIADREVVGKLAQLSSKGIALVACSNCVGEAEEFERMAGKLAPDFEPVQTGAGEPAYVLYSSGTTGRPKAIPRRHRDILHCARAFGDEVMGMTEEDVAMAVPKLTFGYGLGGSLLFAGVFGGSCVLFPERSLPEAVAVQLSKYRPSVFLGSPRVIAGLLRAGHADMLRSLRIATSAGESLPLPVLQSWREQLDMPLVDGFGSTEVGHVFVSNLPDDSRDGATGRGLSEFKLKLVDDSGAEVADGRVGRMCVAGPSVADSYLNDPERSAKAFQDGWHVSGDLFTRQSGFYTYVGRLDDMVKKGCGEWISPYEVEDELLNLPFVAESAVVGVQGPQGSIGLKACVVLAEGTPMSNALAQQVIEHTQKIWTNFPHKHLDVVEFMAELPRNASGKVQRTLLRQQSLTEFSYDC